jgi:hypothetical protein
MLDEAENDGFLIDLDLAVKIDREKVSGAPSKLAPKYSWRSAHSTGKSTALRNTVLHDLFFYNYHKHCYFLLVFRLYDQK